MTTSFIYAITVVATCLSVLLLSLARLVYSLSLGGGSKAGLFRSPGSTTHEATSPLTSGLPTSLAEWIENESEPWAREELRADATRLHDMTGDWTQAELELRRRHGPMDANAEVAAGLAWRDAGEKFVDDTVPQE